MRLSILVSAIKAELTETLADTRTLRTTRERKVEFLNEALRLTEDLTKMGDDLDSNETESKRAVIYHLISAATYIVCHGVASDTTLKDIAVMYLSERSFK